LIPSLETVERILSADSHYDASLGLELARLEFYRSGFHASLIGQPAPVAPRGDSPEIEPVTTAEAMVKANVRPWLGQPGWSLYVARVNKLPAAAVRHSMSRIA
jgi:hypothetical protein